MIFPNINYFPTCWENGMKLSAAHFQHLENSIEDAVRDSRALALATGAGFGLLPHSPFEVKNAEGANQQSYSARVILNACRAIMPGGYRVEILPENMQVLKLPAKAPSVEFEPVRGVRYHLFLTIKSTRQVAAGVPQIRPIRHPFLSPDYDLECIPQERMSAGQSLSPNRMKIAEWQDGKIQEYYIPPTLTIRGFSLLEKWHLAFQNQLESTARLGMQVIQTYRNKDAARAAFCLPIVQHVRSTQAHFKWVLPNQSPVFMAAYYGNFAGMVKVLMETGDRDFLRTQLQNGQVYGLLPTMDELLKLEALPFEEMAIVMNLMKNFGDALLKTLHSLLSLEPPPIHSGGQ